ICLNPLGVPSRMNIGQVLEINLGMSMRQIGQQKALEFVLNSKSTSEAVKLFVSNYGLTAEKAKVLIKEMQKFLKEHKITSEDQIKKVTYNDIYVMIKKAGLDIPVSNKAISNLTDTPNTLIVTQEELAERAAQKTPSAVHVSVDNFLATPKYDEIVSALSGESAGVQPVNQEAADAANTESNEIDLNQIDEVIFAYGKARGSVTMGEATLKAIFKNKSIGIPVAKEANDQLGKFNAKNILIVSTIANQTEVQKYAPNAQLLIVDSLVTTPEYDKMVARMYK
ncbi:MAG: hypothetical protein HUJ62_10460, partial [Streptococcus gallolyticus]|nr:hypothetical protein [Streptococcus gallolyticus]